MAVADVICYPEVRAAQPAAATITGLADQLRNMRSDAWHDREDDAAAAAGAEQAAGRIADDALIH